METLLRLPESSGKQAALEKIPELDGVRGIAILAVIVFHFGYYLPAHPSIAISAFLAMARMGWTGVDLFFVLSGFLITRILLNSKRSPHYFKSFYIRRALRILPVYYTAVFVFFYIVLPLARAFHPSGLADHGLLMPTGHEQLWYWFHLSNWRSAWGVNAGAPIGHFWSLAVEEQFYFVWPLVVLLCSETSLLALCVALILASIGLRCLPVFQAIEALHTDFIYRITPFRLEPLLLGAILAIAETRRLLKPASSWLVPVLFVLGCGGTLAALLLAHGTEYWSRPMSTFGYTAVALGCAALVLYGIRGSGSAAPGAAILRSPILTQCGKYSYAMYIIQTPIAYLLPRRLIFNEVPYLDGMAATLLLILLGVGLSYLAARCSWFLLEERFLRLKDRFPAS